MIVSVIVPMYRGQKYIQQIVRQVDQCAKEASDIDVELVLYNDCPEEKIVVPSYDYIFGVKCINAEENLGIHGARIQGMSNSSGEYIVFLDQDDKIAPNYIKSQMKMIGEADAVVCRLIHNNRLHYTDTFKFSEVITKEFMLNKWDSIVSPGQVLIKRTAIPDIWVKNILKQNGADDYMLWLLMMLEDRKFALNDEILFEHVISGENISENSNKMMDSEIEMLSVLKKCTSYGDSGWESLKESLRKVHVRDLDTYKYSFNVLKKILSRTQKKEESFCIKERKIAIYGAGELGLLFGNICKGNNVDVRFYIDRNADYILSDIPVYKLESIPQDVEAIVVSLRDTKIKDDIKRKYEHLPVYMIEEVVSG